MLGLCCMCQNLKVVSAALCPRVAVAPLSTQGSKTARAKKRRGLLEVKRDDDGDKLYRLKLESDKESVKSRAQAGPGREVTCALAHHKCFGSKEEEGSGFQEDQEDGQRQRAVGGLAKPQCWGQGLSAVGGLFS